MNNTMSQNKKLDRATKVISMISSREQEVLVLIASGLNNKEIGEKLEISTHTVISHRKSLYRKLDAFNSATLVQKAHQQGILKPDDQAKVIDMISSREKEVLELIATGLSSLEIGKKLFISCHTVISHKKNLYKKLHAINGASLMSNAHQVGILSF